MGREIDIIIRGVEEIISYQYQIGESITFLTGLGEVVEGRFIPHPDQSYISYLVQGEDLVNLLAATPTKPKGVFWTADLWAIVDAKRGLQKKTL